VVVVHKSQPLNYVIVKLFVRLPQSSSKAIKFRWNVYIVIVKVIIKRTLVICHIDSFWITLNVFGFCIFILQVGVRQIEISETIAFVLPIKYSLHLAQMSSGRPCSNTEASCTTLIFCSFSKWNVYVIVYWFQISASASFTSCDFLCRNYHHVLHCVVNLYRLCSSLTWNGKKVNATQECQH